MTQKKNIAIIGVGVVGIPVLLNLLKRLSANFSITVYSFIPVDRSTVPDQIRIRCMPHRMHQRLKYGVMAFMFFRDHMKNKYQVIHAQSAFPGGVMARWLGRTFNIPWMVTLIGGEVEAMPEIPFGNLMDKQLRKITRKVCEEACFLTVMSGYHAESVKRNLNLHRDIKVLPYAPEATPQLQEKSVTSPVRLLHVAYHHPVKNHDMLLSVISALASRMQFELTIAGANYGETFAEKIQELNLGNYIKMIGPVPYEDTVQLYRDAHILLHTSWYEGLPTVAFEAMAHGAVVCGTHVGIMADFSGTYCVTAAPGKDAEMAEAVLQVVQDPALYQILRERAYAWARTHDANHYVQQMMMWYNELIEGYSKT